MKLVILAVIGLLGAVANADFVLWDDEQLTVDSSHSSGRLYDQSKAWIVAGASVTNLYAYQTSAVDISAGAVSTLDTYDTSTATVSGGSVYNLHGRGNVNISGGSVKYLDANSAASISGGTVSNIYAYDSGSISVSDGNVNSLRAADASTMNISGGNLNRMDAYHNSTVAFVAQDFRLGGGLSLDGNRVLGSGTLSGEWYDGTRWTVDIYRNDPGATILILPRTEIIGDADLSGYVDDDDLSLLLANWNSGTTWGQGDFNLSGNVNDHDLSLLLANWNAGVPGAPAAIPEPTALLLLIGGLVFVRRR